MKGGNLVPQSNAEYAILTQTQCLLYFRPWRQRERFPGPSSDRR